MLLIHYRESSHVHVFNNWLLEYLKRAFKFSGSSVLPAYPGFIVMNSPTVGVSPISTPSNRKFFFLSLIASWMLFTCKQDTWLIWETFILAKFSMTKKCKMFFWKLCSVRMDRCVYICTYLDSYNREYFHWYTIEFIKTAPSPSLSQAFQNTSTRLN